MVLSNQQLIALSGRQRPRAVRRWLDQQRIPYLVSADGWPRVLEQVVGGRLGLVHSVSSIAEPKLRLRNG